MRLLEWLFPALADRHRWRAEEEAWRQTEYYPRRVVRVYRSQRQQRRDARRLRRLGYEVFFQGSSRIRTENWLRHVTYDHRGVRKKGK